MKDERNRLGKGFAVAIVAHVIFALLLGVFGFSFNSNRPPEILEVSLVAGGGAPEEPQEEIVEEAEPIVEEEDQIVESKEKPKEEPKKPVAEKKEQKPKPSPKKGDNKPVGKGDGIGDGQGVAKYSPMPIRQVKPIYPTSARNALIEASVGLELIITEDGIVETARVIKSSGHDEMDANALKAIYKWKFKPGRDENKIKRKCRARIAIKYELDK